MRSERVAAMVLNQNGWTPEAIRTYEGAHAKQPRMPLVRSGAPSDTGKRLLKTPAGDLFPNAAQPEAVLAGLLLYLNCWTEAHEVAQELQTPEGSYWHAIVHRMEPDSSNSGYWFSQVGNHPIFPDLRARAEHLSSEHADAGFRVSSTWVPRQFISFCEEAAKAPGSERDRLATEIQHAEWELLMNWCQQPKKG